jgi:formate hydrogenlyase transcriptional activator
MIRDREFREDLYYRLNTFPISLPPLRERKADIPEFVRYFVRQFAASMDKVIETISEETVQSLVRYPWPGNIRELENYLARGVILSTGGIFAPAPPEWHEPAPVEISRPTLQDKVRQEILTACQLANWKLGGPRGAAERLGLKRTTLYYVSEHLLGQISCVMACSASKTRSPMEFSVFADRILRHFKSSQMVARLRQLRSRKNSQ